ncbi:MAG: protein-(glutamine-N5) methyltransferase, release factor-specific [Candidatus Marinimicrobia bacterium]|nr:protein-(glutamine-N5) methyltransferase, release factor-specific [Candidatus Neomarinimicrobiota bacterium]|tara:strand:+ start:18809 stop:19678 length:870 start_codon:yes stop_codon:yes gene_type:complete
MLDFENFKNSIETPISVKKFIKKTSSFLIDNNISNAKNEIRWYLEKLYNCNSVNFQKLKKLDKTENNYHKTLSFVKKRFSGIPFQYLMNNASFYGREFFVSNKVLIPRPETELIVDILKGKKYSRLLDIGTGSGCLAITAILENIASFVDAVEISNDAIKVAKKNYQLLKARNINFFKTDILKESLSYKYDVIVSNPPYISKKEYNLLSSEVKDYEPYNALTDFDDGYTFYRRYSKIMKELLNAGGIAVFEVSHFFSKEKITEIFKDFSSISFHKDLNNDLRAVSIINE